MGVMDVFDAIREGARLAQKADNIELYSALLAAGETGLEQQRAIQEKDARIAELEGQLVFKGKLKLRDNCLWNEAEGDDIPYCSRCFEADEKAVHLHDHDWTWVCPACKDGVQKPGRGPDYRITPRVS